MTTPSRDPTAKEKVELGDSTEHRQSHTDEACVRQKVTQAHNGPLKQVLQKGVAARSHDSTAKEEEGLGDITPYQVSTVAPDRMNTHVDRMLILQTIFPHCVTYTPSIKASVLSTLIQPHINTSFTNNEDLYWTIIHLVMIN